MVKAGCRIVRRVLLPGISHGRHAGELAIVASVEYGPPNIGFGAVSLAFMRSKNL